MRQRDGHQRQHRPGNEGRGRPDALPQDARQQARRESHQPDDGVVDAISRAALFRRDEISHQSLAGAFGCRIVEAVQGIDQPDLPARVDRAKPR